MKQEHVFIRIGAIIVLCALVLTLSVTSVYAHGDEDHSDYAEVRITATSDIARMERMVQLMQQVIALLTSLRTMQPVAHTPPAVTHVHTQDVHKIEEHHDEHEHDEDEHHDEHEGEARLIVEVEPHNNRTHVHVRYVDKPEDMFFIDAGMSDENGIVSQVSARTGLSADEVKRALTYLQ